MILMQNFLNNLYHGSPVVAEVVSIMAVGAQILVTYALLALAPPERYAVLEWTLLTFLGSSGAALVCFCLNTRIELRRIIIGRCLVAMLFGVVGTRFSAMVPFVMQALDDPVMRIGAGAGWGFLGWVFFAAVFKRAQEREEAIAKMVVQAGETRLAEQVAMLVADKAAIVAAPLANKVEAVATALAEKQSTLPPHVDVTIHQPNTP